MTISVLDRERATTTPVAPDEQVLPCRAHDAELWFAESPSEVEQAKALCLECPVRMHCLAGALDRREPWGVWGGQLFLQGVVIPRKRPRGRPRKDAARDGAAA
jgi:WhiB family redox-sensing transcriptional regulator